MKLCGGMFIEAVEAVQDCPGDRLSIGFLIGQAEKVYMGACDGCMTRDTSIKDAAKRIAAVYGLTYSDLAPETENVRADELWIFRGPLRFLSHEVNSPEWNLHRAALCGVPASEINLNYHGFNSP